MSLSIGGTGGAGLLCFLTNSVHWTIKGDRFERSRCRFMVSIARLINSGMSTEGPDASISSSMNAEVFGECMLNLFDVGVSVLLTVRHSSTHGPCVGLLTNDPVLRIT